MGDTPMIRMKMKNKGRSETFPMMVFFIVFLHIISRFSSETTDQHGRLRFLRYPIAFPKRVDFCR